MRTSPRRDKIVAVDEYTSRRCPRREQSQGVARRCVASTGVDGRNRGRDARKRPTVRKPAVSAATAVRLTATTVASGRNDVGEINGSLLARLQTRAADRASKIRTGSTGWKPAGAVTVVTIGALSVVR